MRNNKGQRYIISILLVFGLLFFVFLFSQWNTKDDNIQTVSDLSLIDTIDEIDKKHKGAYIFGHLDSSNIQHFVDHNIEWNTIIPWGFQDSIFSAEVIYTGDDSLKLAREDSMWASQIDIMHRAGMKVIMKPHVWILQANPGEWRSDIFPTNEQNWVQWQKDYREFILRYLHVAEENNVELFCIGTEFTKLTAEKSDYWRNLIKEIRTIYSGKLTYAANWYEEYEEIDFWDKLDYIGVQAYFPLTKKTNASTLEISEGWNKYLSDLEKISNKFNKKIIFTEMGYKSTVDAAIEPWTWAEDLFELNTEVSDQTQANCYEAFFNTVWDKDWFGGVHFWQMRCDYEGPNKMSIIDFTPQGKLAEGVIKRGFE